MNASASRKNDANNDTSAPAGLTLAEQQVIAAVRAGKAGEALKTIMDILETDAPEAAPAPVAAPEAAPEDHDFCNAAECLALAVVTRLAVNMLLPRSVLMNDDFGSIVRGIAESLADTAKHIGIADLRK